MRTDSSLLWCNEWIVVITSIKTFSILKIFFQRNCKEIKLFNTFDEQIATVFSLYYIKRSKRIKIKWIGSENGRGGQSKRWDVSLHSHSGPENSQVEFICEMWRKLWTVLCGFQRQCCYWAKNIVLLSKYHICIVFDVATPCIHLTTDNTIL